MYFERLNLSCRERVIALLVLLPMFIACPMWGSSRVKVLYSFGGGTGGSYPYAELITDAKGDLYGTTTNGGTYGYGTVFELAHSGTGWKETVLYSFTGASDGAYPYAGLVSDRKGNLYGTTTGGGSGYGVVFELKRSKRSWTEMILHRFTGGYSDGANSVSHSRGSLQTS